MTPLPSSAVSAIAMGIVPTTPSKASLPFSVKLIKFTSIVGAIGATAALVYGIAMNTIPLIVLGSIFIATSWASFYLIHQVANLKSIEESTATINSLNTSLAQKNIEIETLTGQVRKITTDLTTKQNECILAINAQNAAEKKLNEGLQKSADTLTKAQKDATDELEKLNKKMESQAAVFQKQADQDQKQIDALNQTIAKMKLQNIALHALVSDLQTQVGTYQKQVAEYTQLNTQFQQQIQQLKELSKTPAVDVKSIEDHASRIEDAIAKQKKVADQTAQAAADINAMLDALNRRLPAPKTTTTR